MGNVLSSAPTGRRYTDNAESESETTNSMECTREEDSNEENQLSENSKEERAKAKERDMEEFKKQLEIKRVQRREILARHRAEKDALEKTLQSERLSKLELYESNKQLRNLLTKNNINIPEDLQACRENTELTDAVVHIREEFEKIKENNNKLRKDLTESNSALQNAYSDIADLNAQNTESMKQIHALKEVITVSKTMINLREDQLNELKNKLNDIERTLADRETSLLSTDLRQEYERQLQNIRTLRGLYEERARLAEVTRQGLARELEQQKILYQTESNKSKSLAEKIEELEAKVEALHEIVDNKNIQIATCQDETNGLKAEMSVVNKLFSQVLLGYKTKQDLDMLVHRLEENHGILTHMAERENDSEASSALPKLLLEIVSQVDENKETKEEVQKKENNAETVQKQEATDEIEAQIASPSNTTPEEIVENLPKVWRVLMELLSHQSVADSNPADKVTTCYKSVETKSGPVLVPSVSQTYIRLKDLIVEKLGLVKEVNRMKQLNAHLESRLEEQERRLCLVTSELSKTWHVVGRLRRHHHQLHTHEKILKYELQQKRKLLNELKEELEYCREKWEQAREKHTQTEEDWKKLRAEFSSRKIKTGSPSLNNSAESGYSDERPSDESSESNDESEYVAESLIRCKKKLKKSFETILDSSTDYNQVAEREDPASDMLDVADLPLDTQDVYDNHDASDRSKSENVRKYDKLSEETEDEIGDIAHDDSCAEDISTEIIEITHNSLIHEHIAVGSNDSTQNDLTSNSKLGVIDEEQPVIKIDTAEILKNVKLQNERLAKKDEKLEKLEKNSSMLLSKTRATAKFTDEINSTLDNLINRPTSSRMQENINKVPSDEPLVPSCLEIDDYQVQSNIIMQNNESDENNLHLHMTGNTSNAEGTALLTEDNVNNDICNKADNSSKVNTSKNEILTPTVEFKLILENVKRQEERLAKKEKRLERLETSCSEVVNNISNTLKTGEELAGKLDTIHEKFTKPDSDCLTNEESKEIIDKNTGPSTSSELDHEARFAARDLRLKRLEEQTKSLVNKVNKTTSKGVKIHYKLEELHNIYGSENSRASTPSEENNDKSTDDEPRSE
ncbi:hypothetical protein K1T71_008232 [Dendrolimus kikuchii]|uniref:Uncharacterized protein n=1 Tax=Dendrolimus kikuchii TaxID=765133 RepID=A0ACC1CWM7_9NEOP|nr:hypothetical protein K1T71_008232 [Dendrolimus kikuchii]